MLAISGWWKCAYREASINFMFAFSEFEWGMSSERTLGGNAPGFPERQSEGLQQHVSNECTKNLNIIIFQLRHSLSQWMTSSLTIFTLILINKLYRFHPFHRTFLIVFFVFLTYCFPFILAVYVINHFYTAGSSFI